MGQYLYRDIFMKAVLLGLLIITTSINAYACIDLEGTYQQVSCENNKPSTKMSLGLLPGFYFEDENIIKISQKNCQFDFELNQESIGQISPAKDSRWHTTYQQGRDEYKVLFKNKFIQIQSRRLKPSLYVNNKVKVKMSFNRDDELVVDRKEVDTWTAVYTVKERWNSKCVFKRID
jgi:hypothetical protein